LGNVGRDRGRNGTVKETEGRLLIRSQMGSGRKTEEKRIGLGVGNTLKRGGREEGGEL